jgi:hypothetical protein
MKITRNGIEFELTDQEIEDAYRERRRYYNMEDIKSKIENMIEEYEGEPEEEKLKVILEDEEKIRDLADAFDNALDENDSFMESFWMTAENVILDELEEE